MGAPAASATPSTTLSPNTWKNGSAPSTTSDAVTRSPGWSSTWRMFDARFPCVSIAAFGAPAVPEVKSSTATSSSARSTRGTGSLVSASRSMVHGRARGAEQRRGRAGRQRDPGIDRGKLALDLGGRRERVQGHRGSTGMERGEITGDEGLVVGAGERHAIPRLDAPLHERAGEPRRVGRELRVRRDAPAPDKRGVVGDATRQQHLDEVHAPDRTRTSAAVSEREEKSPAAGVGLGAGWEAGEAPSGEPRRHSRYPRPRTGDIAESAPARAFLRDLATQRELLWPAPPPSEAGRVGAARRAAQVPRRSTNWAKAAARISTSSAAMAMVVPGRMP